MKCSSVASRPNSLVCPLCEAYELKACGHSSACCNSCGSSLSGAMLETLRSICALPDVLGKHACECGHPEMRLLPDGTFRCPACGSEVLPLEASGEPEAEHHSEAYWAGWVDGRFAESDSFVDNPSLAKWGNPSNRLDYYRGHRAGSEARQTSNSRDPDIREELFG